MAISVLLVDDHAMVREGFSALISKHRFYEIAAEVANGRDAVEQAHLLKPDVVLMDIGIPELNGIDACRRIVNELPSIRVIALTMHASNQKVIAMLRAGAMGYILKNVGFTEVVMAIDTVMKGNRYLSPSIAHIVVDEALKKGTEIDHNAFTLLTAREREVLQLFAEGRTSKEIAFLLKISGRTVDAHRKNLMEKLHLNTLADLTRYALSEGIIRMSG